MRVVYLYLLTIPIFFAIDMIWLGFLARGFYRDNLGHLMRPDINWFAALVFYLLYIAGIMIFATMPSLEKNSLRMAVVLGGLFGFFAYATYDLTNQATVKDWPLLVTVIDLIWGIVLSVMVSTISYYAGKWLT